MSGIAITITRDDLDQVIRAEAARQIEARLASMPMEKLAPQLDWRPASWFAAEWNMNQATFFRLARKVGLTVSSLSGKVKLYSVAEANEKIRARGIQAKPRRARVTTFPAQ